MKTITLTKSKVVAKERVYSIKSSSWMVRDIPRDIQNPHEILSSYTNDIYKLLLKKLSDFEASAVATDDDAQRIVNLTQEFIKIKKMLAGEDVNIR